MSRYIDADAAIEAIKRPHGGCYTEAAKSFAVYQVLSVPTADVVEVVRCKDCKHSIEDKLFGGLWCQHPTEKHCERDAYFYCGSGERRTDDAEIH